MSCPEPSPSGCAVCGQELYTLLQKALPTDAAEHILRAVISHVNSSIVMLFVSDEGVAAYNMFALYRLHADLRGLTRLAETFEELPGLEVRLPCPYTPPF